MPRYVDLILDKIGRFFLSALPESVEDFMIATLVVTAHYYCAAKGALSAILEKPALTLPDGSPSGATIVNTDDLSWEVAYSWWHAPVLLERVIQNANLLTWRSSSRLQETVERSGDSGAAVLPKRLGDLLESAARRLDERRSGVGSGRGERGDENTPATTGAARKNVVFVFQHGAHGNLVTPHAEGFSLHRENRLVERRGRAGGRRPSVLAAFVDDLCVTREIGRLAVIPDQDELVGGQAPPGPAVIGYLATQGVDRGVLLRASSVLVAPRGGRAAMIVYNLSPPENKPI